LCVSKLVAVRSWAAFTELGNAAREWGHRVYVEDPAALAAGNGRFEIEVANEEDDTNARAVVQAMIDQVPEGPETFTITGTE
jgi:hypothetical protein